MFIERCISKKRNGMPLSDADVRQLVSGVENGAVSDSQLAAFLMAAYVQGMTVPETVALTAAMRDSGQVLHWNLDGPVVDKHSTGGVGDLSSLILAPLLAACGAFVPMVSGRGLGHTGGTVDKLESIPGYQTEQSLAQFQRAVKSNGCNIVAQSAELVPADKRMYALRDVTCTVDSAPLIVSSILSKKLAEGLDALVMDVKVGNGAFMRTHRDARAFTSLLMKVAAGAGLPTDCIISDMNAPISDSVGNGLEVREAVDFLTAKRRNPALQKLIMQLAVPALLLPGLADSKQQAMAMIEQALESGAAAEKFGRMVAESGGPADLLERPTFYLPSAPVIRPLRMRSSAEIGAYNMRAMGRVLTALGGGRTQAGQAIDHGVGLTGQLPVGQQLQPGDALITIHANSEANWQTAANSLLRDVIGLLEPDSDVLINMPLAGVA